MNTLENIHPFELFPREYLYQKISRRQFFEVLKVGVHLYASKESGIQIPILGILEDTDLYEIIPGILSKTKIIPEGRYVWGIPPGHSQRIRLFEIEPNTVHAFNQINGVNNLFEIAQSQAKFTGLSFSRSFLFTRGLFLTLVMKEVCLPKNNPFAG